VNQVTVSRVGDYLWGEKARGSYLAGVSVGLLFISLGGKEIWTLETRWASIVLQMLHRGDYLHPYLGGDAYYYKPLLSYWLMVASSWLTGGLNLWSLRLPSVLAALLSLYCTVQLGSRLVDRRTGMLAGWMLATTWYFVFWGRVASADMLNVTGTLLAVLWYVGHRNSNRFTDYTVFFLILFVASLCKGLTAVIVPLLVVAPDLVSQGRWRKHLNLRLPLGILPGLVVYLFPFWASSQFGGENYGQSGLNEVFTENLVRFFQPFDTEGPVYTYLVYLPVYTLPWVVLLAPAIYSVGRRWSSTSYEIRWLAIGCMLVFVFFTASGARRSYYILPLVPFALLFTAQWLVTQAPRVLRWSAGITATSAALLLVVFGVLMPLYYSQGGPPAFAKEVRQRAEELRPWSQWRFVILDEHKSQLYLESTRAFEYHPYIPGWQHIVSGEKLVTHWPVLRQPNDNVIFITRSDYAPLVASVLTNHQVVTTPLTFGRRWFNQPDKRAGVAFIPPFVSSKGE